MSSPEGAAFSRLVRGVLERLRHTSGKVEYAMFLALIAAAAVLVLAVVHHATSSEPNVFYNVSNTLHP